MKHKTHRECRFDMKSGVGFPCMESTLESVGGWGLIKRRQGQAQLGIGWHEMMTDSQCGGARYNAKGKTSL